MGSSRELFSPLLAPSSLPPDGGDGVGVGVGDGPYDDDDDDDDDDDALQVASAVQPLRVALPSVSNTTIIFEPLAVYTDGDGMEPPERVASASLVELKLAPSKI